MAKVLVTNIPIHAYATAWVEIPDDTTEDARNSAVSTALLDGTVRLRGTDIDTSNFDLDDGIIEGGWEFNIDDTEEDAAKRDLDALSAYADSKRPA